MTPEGRQFREFLTSQSTHDVRVGMVPCRACGCGCGRILPPGVVIQPIDGDGFYGSRAGLEVLIMRLRAAADEVWGPKP